MLVESKEVDIEKVLEQADALYKNLDSEEAFKLYQKVTGVGDAEGTPWYYI